MRWSGPGIVSSTKQGDYAIDGDAYRWSRGRFFLAMLTSVTLMPGQSAELLGYTHRPEDFALSAGVHALVGDAITTNIGTLVSPPVRITVR